MATKAQERAALEKIRKIVEGLGEDSYIGMAFEGCFEIAEENIENDWGCSMKQNWESAVKEQGKLKERAEKAENMVNKAQDRIDTWIARYHDADYAANENGRIAREAQAKVAELEDEIIRLKAKLYDMMTA